MIITGRTLTQVIAAALEVAPNCSVKMKPDPTTPLKLVGYIRISSGVKYRTVKLTGVVDPWQPCHHFYKNLMSTLINQGHPFPTLTLHKHVMKYHNTDGKSKLALSKQGLVCYGHCDETADKPNPWNHGTDMPAQPPPVKTISGTPLSFPMLDGAPLEPGQTDKVSDVRSKTRSVYTVATSMYVLEYCKVGAARIPSTVTSEIPDHLLMRASHAVQWRNRVVRYAEHFANTFARNLFDYLCMASFGEARHGQGKFTFDTPGMTASRNTAYQAALRYDPRDLLPKLEHAFNKYSWGGSYGGKKWGKIATFAGEYFKPMYRQFPIVFADHVIDLAHNSGLAFNKGYILANPDSESSFMAMLNSKRNGDTFMTQDKRHPVTSLVYELYTQGVSLGVVPRSKAGFKIEADVDVPTLNWGTEHVGFYHGTHQVTMIPGPIPGQTPTPTEDTVESYPVR